MAESEEAQTSGLRPLGVQRLRELRSENDELRARIETLEKELEDERLSNQVDAEVLRIVSKEADEVDINGVPPPGEEEAQPSGPGGAAGPPPTRLAGRRAVPGRKDARRRGKFKKVACNVLFYLALALALVAALFIRATRSGAPVSIAGYSGMLVLTESMQDVIPQHSFVLVKQVAPEELQIGDDITFMVNPTTSVTHRIVDIRPQADGELVIQTKGVNNPVPDTPVPAENIVGKVVYHNLFLGLLAKGIGDNWPLLVFLLAVWTVLGKVLVRIFRDDSPPQGRRISKPARGKTVPAQTQ